MEEFEAVEEVVEAAAGAEAAVEEIVVSEAAQVEASAEVAEMAEAPAIEKGTADKIKDFVASNVNGKTMWDFAKWAGKTGAVASVIFGVTYGLNKAIAGSAHETGKRTGLSQYLIAAQNNFLNQKLQWTEEVRQMAAEHALAFPWIDATQ